ncbi:hypothetical protein L3C95_00170 [Chitinophaga filiformis]|uniref:hypothetical protein n=1 Tax=Chitinophaga filiformis TaxID=104663 RepID=UPI001F43C0D8|nr:hypothetical protein [Chitinophaga filiformis]MCF6401267.1 hypothetical protein [Chitinophaga filiformis]
MRKHLLFTGVAAIAALSLFSCKKDQQATPQSSIGSTTETGARLNGTDELDAILKDLSPDTYLLAFDGLPANNYITKARYGNLSDETQFFGPGGRPPFPELAKIGYERVPFRKIWIKTCPTMIPILDVASRAASLAQKVDPKQLFDLGVYEIGRGQQLLATKSFLDAGARLLPDVVDQKVIGQTTLSKFRLSIPAGILPYFTRGFYGTADITQVPSAGARLTIYNGLKWEDILRRRFPNLIGCFDPEILKDIRANFARLDTRFEKLAVEEVAGGAIIGF